MCLASWLDVNQLARQALSRGCSLRSMQHAHSSSLFGVVIIHTHRLVRGGATGVGCIAGVGGFIIGSDSRRPHRFVELAGTNTRVTTRQPTNNNMEGSR